MKFVFATLFTCLVSTIFAQNYSESDRANILFSLVKGEVRHLTEIRDSSLYTDAKGWNLNDALLRVNLDAALFFSRDYYGYPSFRRNHFFFNVTGKKDQFEELNVTEWDRPKISPAQAEGFFHKILPYHSDIYPRGYEETVFILNRIAGYSPVIPTKDYVDLIALIYHQEFQPKNRPIIRIEVDRGTDPDVVTDCYEYNQSTSWGEIEDRLLARIRRTNP